MYPPATVYLMDKGTVSTALLYIHISRLQIESQDLLPNCQRTIYSLEPYFSFQIFELLPVRKSSYIPYNVQDPVECLLVRPRRYIMPYPGRDMEKDAFSVFQVFPAQKLIINNNFCYSTLNRFFINACVLFDYLGCRAEDCNKLVYPSSLMPQVQRKRIPPRTLW